MNRKAILGELEMLVMLAILRHGKATARDVRTEMATRGGREISRGAMYATLTRLVKKELVETDATESSDPQRFAVSPAGLSALRQASRNLDQMRAGLEGLLESS